MLHIYFYNPATGLFTGRSALVPGADAAASVPIPDGCAAYQSTVAIDPYASRIDLVTGTVVQYQPPAPANSPLVFYTWDATLQRWIGFPTALAQQQAVESQIVAAVQRRLDAFAQTRNYDSILSAATYATSTVPKFAAEGQAAVRSRDSTWSAMYAILAAVQSGTHAMPASYADIEAELPALTWP